MKVLVLSSCLALWLAGVAPSQTQPGADWWVDPVTHLMWTASDNGFGVSLKQASGYCRRLKLGGFNDWSLPSVDELQGILSAIPTPEGYRLRAPLKITGWQWSSTAGVQKGEGWALDFGDGGRASVAAGDSGLNRALCVRK